MRAGPQGPADYSDIINHQRHVSKRFAHMSATDRAAQFLPFDALSGFDDSIKETARLTDERRALGEGELNTLNARMAFILNQGLPSDEIELTVFVNDLKKSGGCFKVIRGRIKKISLPDGFIVMDDCSSVSISDICYIESEIFDAAGI